MNWKNRASWTGIVFLLLFHFHSAFSAEKKPIAYVYDGPGACPEDCAKSAAEMAYLAGFHPVYVGPQALNDRSTPDQVSHFFDNVKVWIQPGGKSRIAYQAIHPKLRSALLNFVFTGGGYVGFCAGAFISTPLIGTTGVTGFSIFPGKTAPLMPPTARRDVVFSIEEVMWDGQARAVYFEGGPYLYDLPDTGVEVMATYANGKVAAARTQFGLGRVYVSGPHPEAPEWWSAGERVRDRDGTDHDLAIRMVQWATHLSP